MKTQLNIRKNFFTGKSACASWYSLHSPLSSRYCPRAYHFVSLTCTHSSPFPDRCYRDRYSCSWVSFCIIQPRTLLCIKESFLSTNLPPECWQRTASPYPVWRCRSSFRTISRRSFGIKDLKAQKFTKYLNLFPLFLSVLSDSCLTASFSLTIIQLLSQTLPQKLKTTA